MDWGSALDVLVQYRMVFVVMFLGYLSHWLPIKVKTAIENRFSQSHLLLKAAVSVLTGIICYQAYSASFQPFIYFQF
jgi:hypothetical protein